MLNSGPGARAAGTVADTWSGLSGALADIQQEISTGVHASGASWVGAAADSARGVLGPLGEWAQQASAAAELMQVSTSIQGELLGKARSDMPAPIPAAAQPGEATPIQQLVAAQLDAEVIEAAHDAAAERAFQVMRDYEAATADNTATLGDFGSPPKLVVDTSPITGAGVPRQVGRSGARVSSRLRSAGVEAERAGRGTDEPAAEAEKTALSEPTAPATRSATAGSETTPHETTMPATGAPETTASEAGLPEAGLPETTLSETPGTTVVAPETIGAQGVAGPAPTSAVTPAAPVTGAGRRTAARQERRGGAGRTDSRTASGRTASGATATPRDSGQTTASAAAGSGAGTPAPARGTPPSPADGAMLPVTGGARGGDDAEMEPNRLVIGEDIYGEPQTYTPPVIGERPPNR